ncbi:MAG: endo alpha-1,4 polygalactosaminidase [Selenomonas sp.]|uniref:endo alpha-1,4 polygalactosaminidase n=1 Tax=Selenomonas sp. TaxID=2053611 RepID=UPI0025D22569|nr:endo alpha-1,4 polygalactosaminidase [Selenomonas sp.]MCI6101009.1 endo alpha-1,4 polygalactosaminidase [Selenomonas sp.]MCI6232991.1 endo alpha-1,4 polygalactosaminidase [Selenomonas sp.]
MQIHRFFHLLASALFGTGLLLSSGCENSAEAVHPVPEQEMTRLAADLSGYAKSKSPTFQFVGNGAAGLLEVTDGQTEESVQRLVGALDGFLTESFFYLDNDGEPELQDPDMLEYLEAMMEKPQTAGKAVWTLDYLSEDEPVAMDRALGHARGYVSMTAAGTGLASIPDEGVMGGIPGENSADITTIRSARNFLILLNPGNFASREDYLSSLAATPYDALVIDLYYGDAPLSADDVARLQQKPQGGRRLVLAYMSVGEAADYRPYWQPSWNDSASRPKWIAGANDNWPGAYRVRYWSDDWRRILYGSEDAYLDMILAAGFDGAFLDVMDAWQTFK